MGSETRGERQLREIAALFASLTPARRERVLTLLREVTASLDESMQETCNPSLRAASV